MILPFLCSSFPFLYDRKDDAPYLLSYPKDAKVSISSNITNVEKTSPIQTNDDILSFLVGKVWSFMSIVLINSSSLTSVM